jgi:hypothetical protein
VWSSDPRRRAPSLPPRMAPPAGAGTEGRPARRRGTGTGTGTSPGRTKVWVEPPGKSHGHHHHQAPSPPPPKRVAVVYYLCRNRHLEHPHFIEVPLAVPEEGLYLRGQSVTHSSHPYLPQLKVPGWGVQQVRHKLARRAFVRTTTI